MEEQCSFIKTETNMLRIDVNLAY